MDQRESLEKRDLREKLERPVPRVIKEIVGSVGRRVIVGNLEWLV